LEIDRVLAKIGIVFIPAFAKNIKEKKKKKKNKLILKHLI